MTYVCSMERLLDELQKRAPQEITALRAMYRTTDYGLLSVGLKLHCLNKSAEFDPLVKNISGWFAVTRNNTFRLRSASFCLVLPPLGSARAATALLEAIARYCNVPILGNPNIHVQMCSPGKLSPQRIALLAIAFYLSSYRLRRYSFNDLDTTARDATGRRLVLYDAFGPFDEKFTWLARVGDSMREYPVLPLPAGRSDVHLGHTEPSDIENVNLIATLLCHAEYSALDGFWHALGLRFERDMVALLTRHQLAGILHAGWVRNYDRSSDVPYFLALQELIATALQEAVRVKAGGWVFSKRVTIEPRSNSGLLHEATELIHAYDAELRHEFDRHMKEGGHDAHNTEKH